MSKASDMFFAKIKEDSNFAKKLADAKEVSQVQQLLKEEGIELTIDELIEIKNLVMVNKTAKTSELSEEELEHVAGGATPAIGGSAAATAASIEHCRTAVSIITSVFSGW